MKNASLLILLMIAGVPLSAQKVNFSASKNEILLGDSVELTWKVKKPNNPDKISISGFDRTFPLAGSVFVSPEKSRGYALHVDKKGRRYSFKTYLRVIRPDIKSFKTRKKHNTDEDSTTLMWEVANAARVTIDDMKNLPQTGQRNFLLDSSKTFTLKAYNDKGVHISRALNVPIENIEYLDGPTEIYLRDTLKLKWLYKFTKNVQIRGFDVTFNAEDSLVLVPEQDTTYYFSVFRQNEDTLRKEFRVTVKNPVDKFYVPKVVYKRTAGLMQWDVRKGFKVKLTGTDKPITTNKGQIRIPVDTRRQYTLTVRDQNNEQVYKATKRIRSVVSPIQNFSVPKMVKKGTPATLYWEVAPGFETRIPGIGSQLNNADSATVVPVENTSYMLIASLAGRDIDTVSANVEVIRRRAFIRDKRSIAKLNADNELHFDIFSVEESQYPRRMKLKVLAVDDEGYFVSGLAKANDGRKKKIVKSLIEKLGKKTIEVKNFTFREVSELVSLKYNIALALDYSGSMYGTINHLEEAVGTFISGKDSLDQLTITKYDDDLIPVSGLLSGTDTLIRAMNSVGIDSLGGSTALYAGSDMALQSLKNSGENRVLLLFTDGMENASLQYMGFYAYTATSLAKKARKQNTTVHVIAYGAGVRNNVLKQLAYTTGGNFYKLNDQNDIQAIFKELPLIFRNYYEITYKPAQGKGHHTVQMIYDNLQGYDITITTDYQIGDDFVIDEVEPGLTDVYWRKAADSLNKTPISVPQAVAYFQFDKDSLEDQYKPSINSYVKYLNKNPAASILVFGHTDSRGPEDYCYELSERRGLAVKKHLTRQGIAAKRIKVVPCGKSEMIWYPENAGWKARENRRIEILLMN